MSFTVAYNIKAIDQFTAVADKVRQSLDKMERSAKSLNDVQRKATSVAAAHAAKVKTQSSAVKNLGYQTKLGAVESNMLSDKFRKNAASLSALNALTVKNAASTKLATQKQREMKRALTESSRAANQANRNMRNSIAVMRDVGEKANQVGNFMLTRVALPLVGLGTLAYKASKDFNKGMANVGTLIPGQSDKLKRYKGELQGMMVEFGQSGGVMTEGLYQVISSVGDTTDAMDKLKIATRAAVAGNAETAASVNLLTGISADYGDTSAAMMKKVSDLAFKTVELGVTTFPELAQNMGRTTTQAKMFGVSVEELFGSYAGLTSGTVRTEMVTTRLAGVFAALGKRTGPIVDVMKKMGVASGKDLIAKFGGLQGALFALRREVGGNEIAFSKLFEDQEGRLGALALTGAKAKETAKEVAAMKNAADSTNKAFKEQAEGIGASGFRAEQTKAKFERLSQEWGDKLIPIADKLMDRADKIITWLSSLDDKTINAAMEAGIFAIKLGLVSKGIGGILKFSSGVSSLFLNFSGGASASAMQAERLSTATTGLKGSVSGLNGVLGAAGPLLAAFSLGVAGGLEIWDAIEKKQKKELDVQNKKAKLFSEARKMSLPEATNTLESMKKRWDENEQTAKILAKAGGQKYKGRDLLHGEFSKIRSVRIEQENARALQRRIDSLLKVNEEQSAGYFYGQRKQGMTQNKDEITIKFESQNGEKITEIKHERDSGSKKFALGSNT